MQKRLYLILVGILVFHLFILSQLQFTAWPEMISFPYLLNQSFVNYKDMIHAYPPLLVDALAVLFKIFGYNIWVLKVLAWSSFIASDILIFVVIRRITKRVNLAITGVLVYAISQPVLDGNMVWPDLMIIPSLLVGTFLLFNKKYFLSGFCFALALLTKQTAVLYIVCGISYIVFTERNLKKLFKFLFGGLIIGVPFLISLISQNSLNDFINWTIIYPSKYWTKFPGYVQLSPSLRENIILLVLLVSLAFLIFKSNKKIFGDKIFLTLFAFLVAGIVGVYPRFSFFHLQPAIAMYVILVFYLISQYHNIKYQFFILLVPVLIAILLHGRIVWGEDRFWNQKNLELGKIIQERTPLNKPVYFIGLDSSVYAFSNRLPNKPWSDNFGWYLEISGVQDEVIRGFESDPPSAIFWQTPENGNWYDIGAYNPKKITEWVMTNYIRQNEVQKGIWEWTLRSTQGKL